MSEPLTREERDAFVCMAGGLFRDDVRRYEATVRAVEAERDDARDSVRLLYEERDAAEERAERLRAALYEIGYHEGARMRQIRHARRHAIEALAADDAAKGETP